MTKAFNLWSVSMKLQLSKLVLSPRQKCEPNTGEDRMCGPEIFFWTDGLILLDHTRLLLDNLPNLPPGVQSQFWAGVITADLLKLLPSRTRKMLCGEIIDYCRVRQSQTQAWSALIAKARGEKISATGGISRGGLKLDEKQWAIVRARRTKVLNRPPLPKIIERAVEQNDVRFLIRLGKALQSKPKSDEVEWSHCPPLMCFLVMNWVDPANFRQGLPVLCQFTDEALADYCAVAFGQTVGDPSIDAIRKIRQRLGLKQVVKPRVRSVKLKGNELLFG